MPTQHKNSRYQKRSHSSDSDHAHRNRQRRAYDKERPERFEKYHRRSRSKSPQKQEGKKSKYTYHYQPKDEKRYYQDHREIEKSKHYDNLNKSYDPCYSKRDQFEKRDRQKVEQYPFKMKFNRNEENDYNRNRDRQLRYQRGQRAMKSLERDHKRRKNSSSSSRSSSPKQYKRNDIQFIYTKRSSPDTFKDQGDSKRNRKVTEGQEEAVKMRQKEEGKAQRSPPKQFKHQPIKAAQVQINNHLKQSNNTISPTRLQKAQPQKEYSSEIQNRPFLKLRALFPPPPPSKVQRQQQIIKDKQTPLREPEVTQQKIIKQFNTISPIKRFSDSQMRQTKQQQPCSKTKGSKFQLELSQARRNLVVAPPSSSFLLLDTFKTMNKYQVETLDAKWANSLKKDMEKYAQMKQETMSKLSESSNDEGSLLGKQYMWIKEDCNEQELDFRFKLEEFKLHNATVGQLFRKFKLID